ncbi:hypothetical protein Mapa_008098 [Marchantia paleacea]|nr:hypothetical protein Mapa_008098 [Marchantia paleacea]
MSARQRETQTKLSGRGHGVKGYHRVATASDSGGDQNLNYFVSVGFKTTAEEQRDWIWIA